MYGEQQNLGLPINQKSLNLTREDLCRIQEWFNITKLETLPSLQIGILLPSGERVVPTWFKCFLGTLYCICIVWAVPANLQTLYRVMSNKKRWTSTNTLICVLAFTDLLTLCTTVPTEMTYLLARYQAWVLSPLACPALTYLQNIAILLNAAILCLIAWDRYRGVVNALTTGSTRNPKTVLILVGIAFISCLVISVPTVFYWETYDFLVGSETWPYLDFCDVHSWCAANQEIRHTDPNSIPAYYISLFVFIFAPLMTVYIVFYAEIIHFLWLRKPVGTNAAARQQSNRKKRIATALLILVLSFFICRMPIWTFIVVTMMTTVPNSIEIIILKCCLAFISVLNTGLNPHLYGVIGDPLKNKRKKDCTDICLGIFCCFSSSGQDENTVTFSSGREGGSGNRDGGCWPWRARL